jgi:hypothetical protein
MGTGCIILTEGSRKHYLGYIYKKLRDEVYNRTPHAIVSDVVSYPFHESPLILNPLTDIPLEISGNQCKKLFYMIQNDVPSFNNQVSSAVICQFKPILPDLPVVTPVTLLSESQISSDALLKQFEKQFGELAAPADTRPTATESCIQVDPSKNTPNIPLRRYNPGELGGIRSQVNNMLKQKMIRPSTSLWITNSYD